MRQRWFTLVPLVVALLVAAPAGAFAQANSSPSKSNAAAPTPVNLNTATAAQLEKLPGVGVRTAKLIIEHREKNGGFKKIEELMNIKGIGEKSFLKLKPMVTVGSEKPERPRDKP